MKWSDLFSRPTDILLMHVTEARVAEKTYGETTLTFYYNRLLVESDEYELDKLDADLRHRHRAGDSARGDGLRRREIHRGHRRIPRHARGAFSPSWRAR